MQWNMIKSGEHIVREWRGNTISRVSIVTYSIRRSRLPQTKGVLLIILINFFLATALIIVIIIIRIRIIMTCNSIIIVRSSRCFYSCIINIRCNWSIFGVVCIGNRRKIIVVFIWIMMATRSKYFCTLSITLHDLRVVIFRRRVVYIDALS